MLATDQHTHNLLDAAARLLFRPEIIGPILAVPAGIAVRQVRKLRRQAKKQKVVRVVRGWLAVSAVIDVVSVSEHLDSDGKKYYLATLTYFYRLPNLEMGDYQREFPLKTTAQNWVKQFKGHHVMAHVNPKEVADSFLLESDLEGLETHQNSAMESPAMVDAAPALSHGSRFLTALGEQISLAGLAACAVLLTASLARGGIVCPRWLLWTGGAMLAVSFVMMVVVRFQCRSDESATFLLHSYKQWSPAWMRWCLQGSTTVLFLLWFLHQVSANLPSTVQLSLNRAEPHLPYFIGCLGFLATASFHTAILRSQEQVRLPVNAE